MRKRGILAIGLALSVVLAGSALGVAQGTSASSSVDYALGYQDGLRMGSQDAPYFESYVWGFLSGLFYLLYAMATEPKVPMETVLYLEGKSPEYKAGFIKGYKDAKQRARLTTGAVGWGTWLIILFAAGSY